MFYAHIYVSVPVTRKMERRLDKFKVDLYFYRKWKFKRTYQLVSWKFIMTEKKQGDIKIRSQNLSNKSLLFKQLWSYLWIKGYMNKRNQLPALFSRLDLSSRLFNTTTSSGRSSGNSLSLQWRRTGFITMQVSNPMTLLELNQVPKLGSMGRMQQIFNEEIMISLTVMRWHLYILMQQKGNERWPRDWTWRIISQTSFALLNTMRMVRTSTYFHSMGKQICHYYTRNHIKGRMADAL